MNEKRSIPASLFFSFSFVLSLPFAALSPILLYFFIQIAIKINHFCVFPPFLCLLMNLIILFQRSQPPLPFLCFALRAQRNHLHLMFIFAETEEQKEKNYFCAVDLCSLERYDFYFHSMGLPFSNGGKCGKFLLFKVFWYLREFLDGKCGGRRKNHKL